MLKIEEEYKTFRIDADVLYKPSYIEEILGQRYIQKLRYYGLHAVGKRYWGKNIIDSINQMFNDSSCRRVGKEELNDKDTSKERMDKDSTNVTIHPIQGGKENRKLASQVEEARRRLVKKII